MARSCVECGEPARYDVVRVGKWMSGGYPEIVRSSVHETVCEKHATERDDRGEIGIGEAVRLTG